MRRPCRTQDPRSERFRAKACSGLDPGWAPVSEENTPNRSPLNRSSVIAGTNPADVIAEGVELAHPAAAAIAIVIVAVVAGGDGAADHGGAEQTGADTPAAAPGLCLGGGGCDRAGDGEGRESKCCNFGFDRHDKFHPIGAARCGPHIQLDGASPDPVRIAARKLSVYIC